MKFEAYSMILEEDGFKRERPETYVFCQEKGKLQKLGDGSFGIVYKIKNLDGVNYAVKLFFYREDKENDLNHVAKRFSREFSYFKRIRDLQQDDELLSPLKIKGIIEPVKATDLFTQSKAYLELFGENGSEKQKIRVSDYAIVLPLYTGTLKDLLEKKSLSIPNSAGKSKTGYDILKRAPADLRVLAMIPILDTIVEGLKFLYFGSFRHLDIKPANIFYRLVGMDSVEFTLADMGYLDTNIAYQHTIIMSDQHVQTLLGSLSYRSPEQVNYFDRSDAKILVDGLQVKLIITDPKFKDTLIRKGDLLFFSKSEKRQPYVIEHIDNQYEEEGKVIVVTSQVEKGDVSPEDRTQVEFRKVQGIKTDLFGLGAVALDLLTAGASPEGFYEKLKNNDHEKYSVEEYISDFRNVTLSQSEKVENKHIFQDLMFIGNSTSGEKIVKFILKCMLYNAKDTFAKDISSKLEHEVFDNVKKELDEIRNEIQRKPNFTGEPNRLVYQMLVEKNIDKTISSDDAPGLSKYLDNLHKLDNNKFYWRLARGVKYLIELINFIREKIYDDPSEEKGKDSSFFIECYPRNLFFINNELNAYITFASKKDQYITRIAEDVVINNLNASYIDFFVPDEIAYMKRMIELTPLEVSSTNRHYYYNPLSKAPPSVKLKKGDWITRKGKVYEVEMVDLEKKIIEISNVIDEIDNNFEDIFNEKLVVEELDQSLQSSTNLDHEKTLKVTYYHDIDRIKYYLEIIAIYIQQLIFAGQDIINTKEIPSKIKLVKQQLIRNYEVKIPSKKSKNAFDRVYHSLGKLYADLVLTDHEDSFYENYQKEINKEGVDKEGKCSRTIIVKVAGRLKEIIKDIEVSFFGEEQFITDRSLDDFELEKIFDDKIISSIIEDYHHTGLNFSEIIDNVIVESNEVFDKAKSGVVSSLENLKKSFFHKKDK